MTTFRQIEANRRNGQKSTGPKTESGKQRASQNAVRHGLTAETVIKLLEDPDDYHAFEMSVTADYEPDSAVERELVLRLASLLWRLRRATSIETGLLQIEFEVPPDPDRSPRQPGGSEECQDIAIFNSVMPSSSADTCNDADQNGQSLPAVPAPEGVELAQRFMRLADLDNGAFQSLPAVPAPEGVELAQRFMRLADLDNGAFERIGRYEAALWRQVRQTIFTLEALRWRAPSSRSWRTQDRWLRAARSPSDPLEELPRGDLLR